MRRNDRDGAGASRFLRGEVGPGDLRDVQEHCRAIAHECITRGCDRVLIVGASGPDSWNHVAVKDVFYSLAIAGVPDDFRIALVPSSPELAPVYDAAVAYAKLRGIAARRFETEEAATKWLESELA